MELVTAYTAVILAEFTNVDDNEKEYSEYLVLVMHNCPYLFEPREWVLNSKTSEGVAIDSEPPQSFVKDGQFHRLYHTSAADYGSIFPANEAAERFKADGWEVLSKEEAEKRYPSFLF
jgi:hypothetical protein